MNLSKNQIIMLAIGGVALVAAIALGYFAFSAYSTKSEAAEAAESNASAVRSLYGAAISPDSSSVAAVNKNRDALSGWTEAALSTAAVGDWLIATNVNEAAFKQKLVDEARTLSGLPGGVNGKIMKDVAAFGFPDLVAGDKLPEKDQLPRLQRLWGDVSTIVKILSVCGVIEVVRVEPGAAPKQQAQASAEPKDAKKSKKRKKKGAEEDKPAYTEERYTIDFRAKPAALVKVVNALVTSERFIVLESLDFAREGDMIGKALGGDDKRGAGEQQTTSRPRRRRRGAEQEFGEDAAAQDAAAEASKGIVNDPAKEEPFLVRATISTYDFGAGTKTSDVVAPAEAGESAEAGEAAEKPAEAEGAKEEKEGVE